MLHSLRFFLPLALLVVVGAYFLGAADLEVRFSAIKTTETLNVKSGAGAISGSIESITRDLHYLASHRDLKRTINVPNSSTPIDQLAADLMIFSQAKQTYDQLRWIDETGMERIRVDLIGGAAVNIAADKLQNKGKRYFFTDTFKLNPGEVFISPLDLNIEANAIELPYKPTLRLATPVSDVQGVKRGIVIINYYGRELLRAFAEASKEISDHAMLLNSEGYWLKSPKPEDEWGFMFKKPELSLAHRSPHAWAQISGADSGQVRLADGLWTWQSIYPLIAGATSSTGASSAFEASRGEIESRQYVWKSVAHLPTSLLEDMARTVWMRTVLVALLILGMLAYASLRLARAWQTQLLAEAQVQHANALLHDELDWSTELSLKQARTQKQLEDQLEEITLLHAKLNEQAVHDPLTGLYNRRYLDETLSRELSRAHRENHSLAVVMLDLDHFKQVNDTYGHAAGDTVLKELATLLNSGVRESDMVFRFGGEEFLIAMPNINAEQALQRVEALRLALAARIIRHGDAAIMITLSAGISLFPQHGEDTRILIAGADHALYQSKNGGRNRVTMFCSSN